MRDLLNSWKATLILGVMIVFVLGLVWWFFFERPERLADENARIRAEIAIQKGDAKAAEDAINDISDLEVRQEVREELEKDAIDAIQDDTSISDDTYRATLRELCKSASYRNDPECAKVR